MDRREFVFQGIGAVAGAGLAGGLLAACGGDSATGPDGDGGGNGGGDDTFDGTIHLTTSNTFDPDEVTIQTGDTITWENDGDIFHTITPRDPDQEGVWERREMNTAGETFQHTFNATGTFEYFCEPHESVGMTGTIIVEDSS